MNLSLFHNEGLGFKDDFEQNIAQMFSAIAIAESPPCLTYRLLVTPSAFLLSLETRTGSYTNKNFSQLYRNLL